MISARKVSANRANARASTGPKTASGRARAARNALCHGLSLPVYSDPALSEELEALAREIAGQTPTPKSETSPTGLPKRRSMCAACVTHAINSCPIN
jgi:hypothetical protein